MKTLTLLCLLLSACTSVPCDCTQHGDPAGTYPEHTTDGKPIYSDQVEVKCERQNKP